ncbi:MAG: 4Fe-4S ferredoxin, partial [Desulfobacteraceae bacterium]|nr:4Fe-4S ferredoxin [Desulfobacteraceae bacterium]
QPTFPKIPVRYNFEPPVEISANRKMSFKRPDMPMLAVDRRRITFQQAELGYDEESARKEARRCLRCDICRRCGDCVEICRDKMGIDALKLGYLDFDHTTDTDFRQTVDKCITCGACAANCENKAMVIEEKDGQRFLKLCGTVLNKQEIQHCDECGDVLPSMEYMQFISKKTSQLSKVTQTRLLCTNCQRKLSAKISVNTRPVPSKERKKP